MKDMLIAFSQGTMRVGFLHNRTDDDYRTPMWFDRRSTLFALARRGLIRFDIVARLTEEGAKVIAPDPRCTPGERNFKVVE